MPVKMKLVSYSQWQRWADAYHGWRDGRAGIPARPPLPGPVTTGHREALIRQAQDAFAYEYLRYLERVAEPHRRIASERARLDAASLAQTWAESALDMESGALTEPESRRRRLGEKHHPETVILQRRRREHSKLVARARANAASARSNQAEVKARLDDAIEEARKEHRAAVTRVERIHEHIHHRLAVYRRSLVRAHDDAAWANAALSPLAPELPRWALPDGYLPEGIPRPPEERDEPSPPSPPSPPPVLVEEIELKHAVTRVGSERPSTGEGQFDFIEVDSESAAPWHFTLEKTDDGALRLTTRGHSHGPYIDGEPIGTAILRADDCFDFVGYRFTMLDPSRLRKELLGKCDLIAVGLGAKSKSKVRLTEMSFVQRESTVLAVLGPSGAGKTSLFYALLGELPIKSGRFYFRKMPMATHSRQIRESLGFVPQVTELHPSLTVATTLRYGYRLRSPRGSGKDVIDRVLGQVGLERQRDQLLCTLSGGQLRRVSIALELLTDPPLLLLDEPTTGLDAHMDREIMTLLREHSRKDGGHTVIVVTHATEHLSFTDQILVVVDDGAPAYSGPPRQIRKHFNFKMYADLMYMLQEQPRHWAALYGRGKQAKEAAREAEALEVELAAVPQSADGPQVTYRQRTPRSSRRAFRALFRRQWLLLLTRALTKNKRDRGWWLNAKNAFAVAMPLLVAAGGAALAARVAGAPGLGAVLGVKPSSAGTTSLALLTTLCVLSGQALTYSDVVDELEIIRREFRVGVGALPVLAGKWLAYAVLAIAEAGLITAVFCAFPNRAPQHFVAFGSELDLFIGLAALSVASMTLGMLISTLAAKLEHAVALVTLASIVQIALNGVTSSLSSPSVTSAAAAMLPDRWGLAAAASSVDLRGIYDHPPAVASPDALWRHSLAQWLWDLGMLLALSAALFVLAVWRLRNRLKPEKAKRSRPNTPWQPLQTGAPGSAAHNTSDGPAY